MSDGRRDKPKYNPWQVQDCNGIDVSLELDSDALFAELPSEKDPRY